MGEAGAGRTPTTSSSRRLYLRALPLFGILALIGTLVALEYSSLRDLLLWQRRWTRHWTPEGWVAGWYERERFGDEWRREGRDCCFWYVETGTRQRHYAERDRASVSWDPRGTVVEQVIRGERIEGPPWRPGAIEPAPRDAPWTLGGVPFEEWWRARGP
jgi:hypothetical protein